MRSGAARGTRTPDPVITNDVLYQLSYCGEPKRRFRGHPEGIGRQAVWSENGSHLISGSRGIGKEKGGAVPSRK